MIAVTLQVYDLIEQTPFCCGFFHTGVLISGVEWSYGQGGGREDVWEEGKLMFCLRNCHERKRIIDTHGHKG